MLIDVPNVLRGHYSSFNSLFEMLGGVWKPHYSVYIFFPFSI